jgi:hypothetical protein
MVLPVIIEVWKKFLVALDQPEIYT